MRDLFHELPTQGTKMIPDPASAPQCFSTVWAQKIINTTFRSEVPTIKESRVENHNIGLRFRV